jgi:Protein of unknown function (DUF1634)
LAAETLSPRAARAHGAERRDVQWLLRIGLATAAALMAAGLLAAFLGGPLPHAAWRPTELFHAHQALSVRLCGLGILVLSATPAFRVVTLIGLWVRERDWKYVAVAVVVAVVLALAIALGGA